MTFRLPGPLAITVAQVDAMSGGRVELGLGTGWYDQEHTAYGIPFPPLGERFERARGAAGRRDRPVGDARRRDVLVRRRPLPVVDSPALPKPVQSPRPPVIVGGWGKKRTPRLAARFADEFNLPFPQLAAVADQVAGRPRRVRGGRARPVHDDVVGRAGRCAAARTRRRTAAARPPSASDPTSCAPTAPPARSTRWSSRSGASPRPGCERIYLQVLDLHDLDHLRLIAVRGRPGARLTARRLRDGGRGAAQPCAAGPARSTVIRRITRWSRSIAAR